MSLDKLRRNSIARATAAITGLGLAVGEIRPQPAEAGKILIDAREFQEFTDMKLEGPDQGTQVDRWITRSLRKDPLYLQQVESLMTRNAPGALARLEFDGADFSGYPRLNKATVSLYPHETSTGKKTITVKIDLIGKNGERTMVTLRELRGSR